MHAVDDGARTQVDRVANLRRRAADGDDRLSQLEGANSSEGRIEQCRSPEREKLLRLAQAAGRAGRQDDRSDPKIAGADGAGLAHAVDGTGHYGDAVYAIAVSVAACLRGGTRVDVAWNLDPGVTPRFDPNDAVAITPGGGRLGELFGGAVDSRLIEAAAAKPSTGRVIEIDCNPIEASMLGVEPGTRLRVMLAPADTLPAPLWDHLLDRDRIGLECRLDGDTVTDSMLAPVDGPAPASVTLTSEAAYTVWSPRTTLLVMGGGPMAAGVCDAGEFVGWNVVAMPGPDAAVGLAATLSPIDGVVVVGHDIEGTGRVLQAALGSRAGYIGSLGPEDVRAAREEWLAYRGVTDTGRVASPAGLPIGAKGPREVGIAVAADMIARHAQARD